MKKKLLILTLFFLVFLFNYVNAELYAGNEFQVNTFTDDDQKNAAIAQKGNEYIIVWVSTTQSGNGYDIYGQLFFLNGSAKGDEFQINQNTSGVQDNPSVAAISGGFVIIYEKTVPMSSFNISGQMIFDNGTAKGDEFHVLGSGEPLSKNPEVSQTSDGFVVVWNGGGGFSDNVYGKMYYDNGSLKTSAFQVNNFSTGLQTFPTVSKRYYGFEVAWQSEDQDGDSLGVFAQMFYLNGTKEGSEFQVNSYTAGYQGSPSVSETDDGFVIVWSGEGASDSFGIYAQRYHYNGTQIGNEFILNTNTADYQFSPHVSKNAGGFVTVWEASNASSSTGVYGKTTYLNGTAKDEDFAISQYVPDGFISYFPKVVNLPDGFAVAWQSEDQDGSGLGIFARQYFMPEFDSCMNLWRSDETYHLAEDIDIFSGSSSYMSGACINITADNIVLDCQGHSIDGPSTMTPVPILGGWGINISANYVTVRNCNVRNFLYSILFDKASNNLVRDTLFTELGGTLTFNAPTANDSSTGNRFVNSTDTVPSTNETMLYTNFTSCLGSCGMEVELYSEVYVNDTFGNYLDSANVTMYYSNGSMSSSALTGSGGLTSRRNVTEYYEDPSGKTYVIPYNVTASKAGYYSNWSLMNITGNILGTEFFVTLTPYPRPVINYVKTYDAALNEKKAFRANSTISIRTSVSHIEGEENLDTAKVTIKDKMGNTVLASADMDEVGDVAYGHVYEYNYTLPPNAFGLYVINITATDDFGRETYATKTFIAVRLSFQFRMVMTDTDASVYVPGEGEKSFDDIPDETYTMPSHYYVASSNDRKVVGVVNDGNTPISISTGKSQSTYTMEADQDLGASQLLLVFSAGDWQSIDGKITDVESGLFYEEETPSFGYGTSRQKIKYVIKYPYVDISGDEVLNKGLQKLEINNEGESNGKTVLSFVKR